MSGVLGICPVHGVIEIEGVFGGDTGGTIHSVGTRTQCPGCGSWVEIIDGTYKYDRPDQPTITLNPSPAQLLRLQTVASWAAETLKRPDANTERVERKVREAVAKEAPALAPILDRALGAKSATIAGWVAALLAVLALLAGQSGGGVSEEDVVRIIEQVREYDAEHPASPKPAQPEPTQPPATQRPAEEPKTTRA